jgi:hypothetical protein
MIGKLLNQINRGWNWFISHYLPICTIAQTIILGVGVFSLIIAINQIQGTTIQSSYQVTKELMLKAMEDPELQPLLPGYDKLSKEALKQKYLLTLLVNHYYTMFRQYDLGNLPDEYWSDIDKDAAIFFREFIPQKNWNSMKKGYNSDFVSYVDSIYLEKR